MTQTAQRYLSQVEATIARAAPPQLRVGGYLGMRLKAFPRKRRGGQAPVREKPVNIVDDLAPRSAHRIDGFRKKND